MTEEGIDGDDGEELGHHSLPPLPPQRKRGAGTRMRCSSAGGVPSGGHDKSLSARDYNGAGNNNDDGGKEAVFPMGDDDYDGVEFGHSLPPPPPQAKRGAARARSFSSGALPRQRRSMIAQPEAPRRRSGTNKRGSLPADLVVPLTDAPGDEEGDESLAVRAASVGDLDPLQRDTIDFDMLADVQASALPQSQSPPPMQRRLRRRSKTTPVIDEGKDGDEGVDWIEGKRATDSNDGTLALTPAPSADDGSVAEDNGGDDTEEEDEKERSSLCQKAKNNWKRILIRMMISTTMIGSVTFVIVDFFTEQRLKSGLGDLLLWMADNPGAGAFAFIGIFVVGALVFFPPSLLMLGCGWCYGEVYGLGLGTAVAILVVTTGATIGGILAFCRSRYMMRGMIKKFAKKYPIIKAVDIALKTRGFWINLLLRLSPEIPYNALNYIGGITGVSMWDYTKALVIGTIPGTALTVFLGAVAGDFSDKGLDSRKNKTTLIVSLTVGVSLGLLAIVITSLYARKELKKIALEQERIRENEEAFSAERSFRHIDGEDDVDLEDGRQTTLAALAAPGPAAPLSPAVPSFHDNQKRRKDDLDDDDDIDDVSPLDIVFGPLVLSETTSIS